ncbi:hypothetical protein KIPB_011819, partial [Kipferlia bialata]
GDAYIAGVVSASYDRAVAHADEAARQTSAAVADSIAQVHREVEAAGKEAMAEVAASTVAARVQREQEAEAREKERAEREAVLDTLTVRMDAQDSTMASLSVAIHEVEEEAREERAAFEATTSETLTTLTDTIATTQRQSAEGRAGMRRNLEDRLSTLDATTASHSKTLDLHSDKHNTLGVYIGSTRVALEALVEGVRTDLGQAIDSVHGEVDSLSTLCEKEREAERQRVDTSIAAQGARIDCACEARQALTDAMEAQAKASAAELVLVRDALTIDISTLETESAQARHKMEAETSAAISVVREAIATEEVERRSCLSAESLRVDAATDAIREQTQTQATEAQAALEEYKGVVSQLMADRDAQAQVESQSVSERHSSLATLVDTGLEALSHRVSTLRTETEAERER